MYKLSPYKIEINGQTCEGDGEEMAGRDGQSDGEGGAALDAAAVVLVSGGGVDRQHQHQRDEHLDADALKH